MTTNSQNSEHVDIDTLPESIRSPILVIYRSAGLGLYGALIRYAGMPLEKIALYMNSSQVSGKNKLRQAINLAFQDGSKRSILTPYKVVGSASAVAWFLQYSVMGMVFQICDRTLSAAMGVPVVPYGAKLMEDPSYDHVQEEESQNSDDATTIMKKSIQIIVAPAIAGTVESVVSNRAEVQRFYGINKFAQIESSLKWNPLSRICGPAFLANSSRNFIMSGTSFVITPVLYRKYYPQEDKSTTSLFWFGLGLNVFVGNTLAITQQSLWGRALDYTVPNRVKGEAGSGLVARNIHYRTLVNDALKKEGIAAFYTMPKWASRVMMNAPVQGTLPWFYNEILPLAEGSLLSLSSEIYNGIYGISEKSKSKNRLIKRLTKKATDSGILYPKEENNTTATSPVRGRRMD